MTTATARLPRPAHTDPFPALNYRFPEGEEHELEALRTTSLPEPRQRVALTLLALGSLHAGVAEDMGITRQESSACSRQHHGPCARPGVPPLDPRRLPAS